MSVLVIAECGSCHDGDFKKALRLIDAARQVGADCAKVQFWSDADALARRRGVPDVYRDIYRRYQVPKAWLTSLARHCRQVGIEFMVTCYLSNDLKRLASLSQRLKIASFEADCDLVTKALRAVDATQQVIVSAGMVDDARLCELTALRNRRYKSSSSLAILHCVSSYPVPAVNAMNLSVIRAYGLDGLSDHSRHASMGGLAVAAGAEIIEAHLRLDDTDPANPDFATAFTPTEFADYVRNIRFAEAAMGDGVKRLQDCEQPMAAYRVRP